MKLKTKLFHAHSFLESALKDIEEVPEEAAIVDLIEACEVIDRHYQEFCAEFDREDELEEGETYNGGGVSIEYYIEADWWHDVSIALRKLRKEEK